MLHGQVLITQRGALAIPTCDPDFSLIGSPSLLCTDNGWNDTLPVCRGTNFHLALSNVVINNLILLF